MNLPQSPALPGGLCDVPYGSIERELGDLTVADPLPTGGKKVKKGK